MNISSIDSFSLDSSLKNTRFYEHTAAISSFSRFRFFFETSMTEKPAAKRKTSTHSARICSVAGTLKTAAIGAAAKNPKTAASTGTASEKKLCRASSFADRPIRTFCPGFTSKRFVFATVMWSAHALQFA